MIKEYGRFRIGVAVVMILLTTISSYFLFVYSRKEVSWEEDVLLNNGSILLVSRSDIYHRGPEPGNPMRRTWWIESRRYEFEWAGQKVRYERQAAESPGAFMLYVHPESGRVSIIDRNKRCARPGYVEFEWNGEAWVMQKTVSRNAIGLRRNLLRYWSAVEGRIPSRVDVEFVDHSHMDSDQRREEKATLNESELAIGC